MICDGLNARLTSVAEFVRQDAIFADIGTDHAYLPLFLLGCGRIRHAFCSDVNEGPLERARANAKEAGLDGKVTFTLADGASALANLGITDYAICGMGGELIADIIERAPHLRDGGVNLLLQPMSRIGHLRRYLAGAGFATLAESYSTDAGKHYAALLVRYDGEVREMSEEDAELGCPECETLGLIHKVSYLKEKIRAYTRAAEGKRLGGESAEREIKLIAAARARLDGICALLTTAEEETQ